MASHGANVRRPPVKGERESSRRCAVVTARALVGTTCQSQMCPPFVARTYCKRVLSRSSGGPVLASEQSPLFPPLLGRPSQARPHRQPRRLRADCERTRRAIVRWRVKVDDGGSPAEAATTPGIPNPPCRNPQAGIPITFLSPRTIPRPRLGFSSLHTMATSEASPHINAVLECGVKLPLYIFFLPPSP